MDQDPDEQPPEKEDKSSLPLKTEAGTSNEVDGAAEKLEPIHSLLPSVPLIADAGTTRNIEAATSLGQVLPFESQVQGHIGRQLRALYDHVLDQPIPDRFLSLLQQLDEAGSKEEPGHPSKAEGDS
jgi:hypothetical protein